MNEQQDNENFSRQARRLFDDSVERLDAAALSRLNQGRHRALEELENGPAAFGHWIRWLPATGIAAAALIAVMLTGNPAPDVGDEPVSASDFEMLLEEDSLEMLEDLEFYSWLELSGADTNENVG
jgi:hypothetical protein